MTHDAFYYRQTVKLSGQSCTRTPASVVRELIVQHPTSNLKPERRQRSERR